MAANSPVDDDDETLRNFAQPRASEILRSIAERPDPRLSLSELLTGFGERTFGVLILILALINCVPMPPGGSTFFGATLMLVALQMMFGLRQPWFPGFIRRRSVPRAAFQAAADHVTPYLKRIERWTKRRATWLMTGLGERFAGLVIVLLAFVITLPIPIIGNIPPSIAVAIIAISLIERDGLHLVGGVAVGAVAVAINAGVVGAAIASAVGAFSGA